MGEAGRPLVDSQTLPDMSCSPKAFAGKLPVP
jgi:hypothetical protein